MEKRLQSELREAMEAKKRDVQREPHIMERGPVKTRVGSGVVVRAA